MSPAVFKITKMDIETRPSCAKHSLGKYLPAAAWLPLLLGLVVGTNAFAREHQDVALMAHVIGSGAMNIDHYFHSLGVACENRNSGFWKIIEQDREKCMKVRDTASSRSYYNSLPQGSFEKMCRNWKNNEICHINFARDLNDCLGRSSRGSDALEFMEAYVAFSCRDIRDTESQLSLHTRRNAPIHSPGVFMCFPEIQDRILSCVKEDTFSNSLCGQFSTVEHCFSKFYNNYQNCKNIEVVEYLRDLFRSMGSAMKCSGALQNVWNIAGNALEHPQKPIEQPSSPHFHLIADNQYPISSPKPSPNSQLYNDQYGSWGAVVPPKESNRDAIQLLPKPLPPTHQPKGQGQSRTYYGQPHEYLDSPRPLPPPQPLPLPPLVSSYNQSPPQSDNYQEETPLGAWFNLQQRKFSQNNENGGPAWAWGYERYASPESRTQVNPSDRFYSFRVEPRPQQRNDDPELNLRGGGVYDLYQVHHDRYGMPPTPPFSRGLSNRPKKPQQTWRKPKVITVVDDEHQSTLWDLHDNHFRKFKDDHMFQTPEQSSTQRIVPHPRFIHSVPTLYKKRKVKVYLNDQDFTTTQAVVADGGNELGYNVVIISNTTVSPPLLIPDPNAVLAVRHNNDHGRGRSGYAGVIPDIIESYTSNPQQSTTALQPPLKNKQFLRRFPKVSDHPRIDDVNDFPPLSTPPSYSNNGLSYPSNVKVQPTRSYEQDYFPTDATPSKKLKLFSFRPRNKGHLGQSVFPPNMTEVVMISSVEDLVHPTLIAIPPKFRPKNVTYSFPPWPSRNTPKIYGIVENTHKTDDQATHPPLHFDSKRVYESTSSGISTQSYQPFTDLDLEENAFTTKFHPQEESTSTIRTRPKILRKIKVRKRPISSTSTIIIPTDY